MAASPAHDAPFHDFVMAAMFPAGTVSGGPGVLYNYRPGMEMGELVQRWAVFNNVALVGRGVRSCPNNCTCAEDNFCGKIYKPSNYPPPN